METLTFKLGYAEITLRSWTDDDPDMRRLITSWIYATKQLGGTVTKKTESEEEL